MSEVICAQYGSWDSPIISSLCCSEDSVSFRDVQLDYSDLGRGVVYWCEVRPSEGGRGVICSSGPDQKVVVWTPPGYNVNTSVKDYGGGTFWVSDAVIYFSNKDKRLYKQESPSSMPVALTSEYDSYRYADGLLHGHSIYCIREDYSSTPIEGPITSIVRIDVNTFEEHVEVKGSDFYAAPTVSPKGDKLAWMQWQHRNMPWDCCEVATARTLDNGHVDVRTIVKVAASPGVSNILPRFSCDGQLFFVSDRSNWYNLYAVDDSGNQKNVYPKEKECAPPFWVLGRWSYCFDPSKSGDVAVAFGFELGILNLKSGIYYKIDTGYTHHEYIFYGTNKCIYCVASSPTKFAALIQHSVQTGKTEIVRLSNTCNIDEGFISIPETITIPSTDNSGSAYGYFYAPRNRNYKGLPGTQPPLLVMSHGGPTAQSYAALSLSRQFYTSRGFAVVDVNYRGSTGYGRKYRELLYGKCGVYDVEDCCNAVQILAKENRVNPDKCAIRGSSSSGYTTLACLTFRSVFKVGVSHYGISDLEELAKVPCNFEKHYFDSLVGPYPSCKQLYFDRSPINFIDRLNTPIAFFHGLDDPVVPYAQSQKMYNILAKKGLATSLVLFEGEGHGFKKADSIQTAMDGEYVFICIVLGIKPSLALPEQMKISNLKANL